MQLNALTLPILLSCGAGVLAALVARRMAAWVGVVLAGALSVNYISLSGPAGATPLTSPFWATPALGVAGGLRLDSLAALFAVLITGIGALVFLYTSAYLKSDPRQRRLVVMLLLFMMSMLGAVTADDVILLFVFWELTSITSFFLVGYDHEDLNARKAALQALLVTVAGGLALLAGIILLAQAAGTTRISEILAAREAVLAAPQAVPAMLLLVIAAFTKSAQVPFHFWLPNAMAAPTPVSAYLHSATMVKLGIYLLARWSPLYAGEPLWQALLGTAGALTALTATILSLRATDLKRILAYTTVAALGTATLLLGVGTEHAVMAALVFVVVHALYKAALFLIAGIVDHAVGERDATRLRGLGAAMPWTAIAAMGAGLSMAGLPPFIGFVAKELIYTSLSTGEFLLAMVAAIAFLVNVGTVAIAAVFTLRLFVGRQPALPGQPHDPAPAMLAGPWVLALAGLLGGLWLALLEQRWLAPAAANVLGAPADIHLALWHGWTPLFALSLLTWLAGLVLYLLWPRVGSWLRRRSTIDRYGPSRAYDAGLNAFISGSTRITLMLQHGSLGGYLRLLLGVAAAGLLGSLVLRGGLAAPEFALPPADVRYLAFVGLVVGAIAAARAPGIFSAVIAAGLVGFSAALVFLLFGAPDVAFTQFSVEALMVVILATTLARLPLARQDLRTRRQKLFDAALATVLGVAITATLLAILAAPLDLRLSQWFGDYSLLRAHGRNVVNVILVDFRALDTLGELTVLSIAAFAVYALLRARRAPSDQ